MKFRTKFSCGGRLYSTRYFMALIFIFTVQRCWTTASSFGKYLAVDLKEMMSHGTPERVTLMHIHHTPLAPTPNRAALS